MNTPLNPMSARHLLPFLSLLLIGTAGLGQDGPSADGNMTAEQAGKVAYDVVVEMLECTSQLGEEGMARRFESLFKPSATVPEDFKGSDDLIAPGFYASRYLRNCPDCGMSFTVWMPKQEPRLLSGTWVVMVPFSKSFTHAQSREGKRVGTQKMVAEIHVDEEGASINGIRYKAYGQAGDGRIAVEALGLEQSSAHAAPAGTETSSFDNQSSEFRLMYKFGNASVNGLGFHVGWGFQATEGSSEQRMAEAIVLAYDENPISSQSIYDLLLSDSWSTRSHGPVAGIHWATPLSGSTRAPLLEASLSATVKARKLTSTTTYGHSENMAYDMVIPDGLEDMVAPVSDMIMDALDNHMAPPPLGQQLQSKLPQTVGGWNLSVRCSLPSRGKYRIYLGATVAQERMLSDTDDAQATTLTIRNETALTEAAMDTLLETTNGLRSLASGTPTYTGIHIGIEF